MQGCHQSALSLQRISYPFLSQVEASLIGVPLVSDANLIFGVVNHEKPQSVQTKRFANTKTPDLFRFLRPETWMHISAANSARRTDAQHEHITKPLFACLRRRKCKQAKNVCLFKIEHVRKSRAGLGQRTMMMTRERAGLSYSCSTTPRSELCTCNPPL